MASIGVTFTGLDELAARLRTLATTGQAKADELALVTASVAKDAGDPLTPVDTGYLLSRNQIRQSGPGAAEFFNDAPYAVWVCYGHHSRSGSWVAARDWMTPAAMAGAQWINQNAALILGIG